MGATVLDTQEKNQQTQVQSPSPASNTISAMDYYDKQVDLDGSGNAIDEKNVSAAKQSSNASARHVLAAGQKANTDMVDNQYLNQQNQDKQGWSGGYSLDSNRQLEYLKSSIASDIYSQMELQKVGYESALSQAHASAELEKKELSLQRYQTAMNMATQKANLTGKYIDPHFDDMLTQYQAAEKILAGNPSDLEAQRANKIVEFVQKQFNSALNSVDENGVNVFGIKADKNEDGSYDMHSISLEGIKTLAAISQEASNAYYNAQAEYQQALAESTQITIKEGIENSKDDSTYKIPHYTEVNGELTIAGYSDHIDEEHKDELIKYYAESPDAAKDTMSKIAYGFVTAFQQAQDKNSELTSAEFAETFSGLRVNDFCSDINFEGKEGDTINTGIPNLVLKYTGGKWVYTDSSSDKPSTGSSAIDDSAKSNNSSSSSEPTADEITASFTSYGSSVKSGTISGANTCTLKLPDNVVNKGDFYDNDTTITLKTSKHALSVSDFLSNPYVAQASNGQVFVKGEGVFVKQGGKLYQVSSTAACDRLKKAYTGSEFDLT